jgi:hypothetical protein
VIIKFATGCFPVRPVIFPVWAEQIPGSGATGIGPQRFDSPAVLSAVLPW